MKFTWPRIILLVASMFSLIDSRLVPRNADPGAQGDVMLFFILGYRAVSKGDPSPIVVALGALLAIFAAALNRGITGCKNSLCVLSVILALLVILFWGRSRDTID